MATVCVHRETSWQIRESRCYLFYSFFFDKTLLPLFVLLQNVATFIVNI